MKPLGEKSIEVRKYQDFEKYGKLMLSPKLLERYQLWEGMSWFNQKPLLSYFNYMYEQAGWKFIELNIAMFANIVGSYMMKKEIMVYGHFKTDPRFHVYMDMTSGIGKSTILDLVNKFYQYLSLRDIESDHLSDPTPERLIGSVDAITKAKNKKKALNYGQDGYESPIIQGYLQTHHNLLFDECAYILNGKDQRGIKIQKKLREAMDCYGTHTNRIKMETLLGGNLDPAETEYPCKTSFILSTFPLTNIDKKTVLETGIYQRMYCYFFRATFKDAEEMITEAPPEESDLFLKATEDMDELLDYIDSFDDGYIIKYENSSCKDFVDDFQHWLNCQIFGENKDDVEMGGQMLSFARRYITQLIKLASVFAMADREEGQCVIKVSNLEEACVIIMHSFQQLKTNIIDSERGIVHIEKQRWRDDIKHTLGRGTYAKVKMDKIMQQAWNCSIVKAKDRIKQCESMFKITKGKANAKFYKVIGDTCIIGKDDADDKDNKG